MRNELKVGLAVIAAVLLIFFGVRYLQDRPFFGGGSRVVVVFDDAQGLTEGAFVRLNGVTVGTVSAVELSPDAREVFVTMQIDGDVDIPRGVTVGTSGLSALGEVNVELTPPLGADAGRPLVSGDTLRAASTPDLFDLLAGESTGITARADSALVRALSVFTTLDNTLSNSGDDVTAVLAQLRFLTQTATQTLLNERERIGETLAAFQSAAGSAEVLASDLSTLGTDLSTDVSTDIRATTGTLRETVDANADSISVTVAQLNTTLRAADGALRELETLSTQLNAALSLVDTDSSSLGLMLRDPSLYYNANAAAASLQQLIQDIQRDPGRYARELEVVDIF
ncbi:MAG: MlaD family protein [Bacteroidota bacterium]